jgi:hypothetical protein
MGAARSPRRRESQLAFEALSIEGGLLSPEWLSRVGQLSAGVQSEADYRVPKGLNLRDEIGRYWRIAQANWREFEAGRSAGASTRALAEHFVPALLRESFAFDTLTATAPIAVADRTYPIGFSALVGRVPIVIAPAGSGVDALASSFGDGGRRRSAFGVAQEFLNTSSDATWGLVSDGLTLRIVRDNASLTRPAWVEADLERIFTEGRYADFAALWLLAHETRFGKPGQAAAECPLETWRVAGREEGTRAREHLRRGVEEALVAIGQGFLSHPDNSSLRNALQDGSLTKTDYFQQLLRLVYRLIFLLTAEERGLLHPNEASAGARHLYAEGYGLKRLRDRSVKRSAHDRFSDLWEAMKIVFLGVANGESRLGLPALAGLFAATQCPSLDAAKLENHALLLAVFRLSWLREASGLSRVNWRDMGPEELGSVYESLLELQPQITQGGRAFVFATGGEAKGHARKTTGSYYTHDSLVQALLDSALEPVVKFTISAHPVDPVHALLSLSVVDPACGSGHFLLAAARRLASHVARLRADGTPSAADYRHALREVVGRCIYGVDQNPMAVELCKVSLWMEAVEPGLPLTFLNSHIQHGNALLGATPALMANGVPDAAWDPIEGDDKRVATALKKRNKKASSGQRGLSSVWSEPSENESLGLARAVAELEAAADADIAALARKELQWESILHSAAYRRQRFVADSWCAAFVWPKQPGPIEDAAPTNELWRQIRDGQGHDPVLTVETTNALALEYDFFHWHLAFPQVFARGGFDVVLGNPPWDEIQFEETSWFASREPEVAQATTAADREKRIHALQDTSPDLFALYEAARRQVDGIKHFARDSGLYPAGSYGKLNTYALFVERDSALVNVAAGYGGFVVPTGIATDKGTSGLFKSLMVSGRLRSLYDFVNEKLLFPAVRPHQHFCLLTLSPPREETVSTEFAAFLLSVEGLSDANRLYGLTWREIVALNPEAETISLFPSKRHSDVTRRLIATFAPLGSQTGADAWGATYQQGTFNTASASEVFRTESQLRAEGFHIEGLEAGRDSELYVPLFDPKLARQCEWRAASLSFSGHQFRKVAKAATPEGFLSDPNYLPAFAYWVPKDEADARLGDWNRPWLLGFKDVTGITSTRLSVFAVIPRMGVGDGFPLLKLRRGGAEGHAFVLAWMNSILVEFFLRQRMQGLHLTWHLLGQVPLPSAAHAQSVCLWDSRTTIAHWIASRVAELSVTAWPLRAFSRELGTGDLAFKYSPARRLTMRDEIEAALFVIAGIPLESVEFTLDSLEKLRARDQQHHGTYRTKRSVVEIYTAMAQAVSTGQPYITPLDPPPASFQVAHAPEVIAFDIKHVPDIVPVLRPDEEVALAILAILHASGGTITRMDLARSFALRSHPSLLKKLAPAVAAQIAQEWAGKITNRTVPPGSLARVLKALTERDGVKLTIDASSRSVVTTSAGTPLERTIAPWFRFEARLALSVLAAIPSAEMQTVDAGMAGDDRRLLETGVA